MADGLHLWQYEAAFGSLTILRHDEQHRVARLGEVAGEVVYRIFLHGECGERLEQVFHAFLMECRNAYGLHLELFADLLVSHGRAVGFVEHGHEGQFALACIFHPFLFNAEVCLSAVYDEDTDFRLFEFLTCLGNALLCEQTVVVKSGRVEQYTCPQFRQFDVLSDYIGSRARLL